MASTQTAQARGDGFAAFGKASEMVQMKPSFVVAARSLTTPTVPAQEFLLLSFGC